MQYIRTYIIIINNENEFKRRMMGMKLHYGLNDFKDIDLMAILPILLPVIFVGMILVLIALIDLYRHRKTRKNVLIWTLIILFVSILGPILYFVIGRKDSERS